MSCPKCVEGYELPGDPTGSIQSEYQGAYFSPAPNGQTSKKAIILLTDGFGLPLKNCKLIADKLANRLECDVWVPDYFDGRPLVPLTSMTAPDRADQKMTVFDWIKFILYSIPNIPAYISSRPSVVDTRVASFIALLKSKKSYEKLGAVGYCYGGSTCIRLASKDLVNGAVICHPGPFTISEVRAIKVPTAWAIPEADIFVTDALRLQAEADLAGRKGEDHVDYEFVVYKGTAHGFASRPNLKYADIMGANEQAFEQTVNWFKKTLVIGTTPVVSETSTASQPAPEIASVDASA